MEIRNAIESDIPQIVSLLKLSLGESLMPKSEAYWRWKHIDNPFGPSPVLLAEEDGQIIGVRAFMRWEWTDGKKIYKAIRAVDTATHPDHQGKGIFKMLTLKLVEDCKNDGDDFIFNTPNTQSRPGYLKMGWLDAGRLPVRLFFAKPLWGLASRLIGQKKQIFAPLSKRLENINISRLLKDHKFTNQNHLNTNYTNTYLQWRYANVPVVSYETIYMENDLDIELLVFRIKKSGPALELRITDYLSNRQFISPAMLKAVRKQANKFGATHLTFSGTIDKISAGFRVEKGPIVTVRDLQFIHFNRLSGFQYWQPSIGDLELF